jgi:hypothetical protein
MLDPGRRGTPTVLAETGAHAAHDPHAKRQERGVSVPISAPNISENYALSKFSASVSY